MITISDRKLNFSKGDVNIGFQGDNLIETRVFELAKLYNDTDLSLMDFKLDMQNGANKNVIDLEKSITDDKIILTWTILESHLINDGIVDIQIRGFNDGTEKWHSDIGQVRIKSSINASKLFPDILPSEFIDMEARVTEVKNIAITQAEIATLKAGEAFTSAAAAKQSEINAGKAEAAALIAIAEATEQADRAEGEADKSTSQASKSESYAIGGTGTRPGEDTDNSKHYSEVAQFASESVVTSAGAALSAKQAAETARDKAEDAQVAAETAKNDAKAYADSIYLWQKAPSLETMDNAIMLYSPLLASI